MRIQYRSFRSADTDHFSFYEKENESSPAVWSLRELMRKHKATCEKNRKNRKKKTKKTHR